MVPPGIAAWVIARLCEGLQYAHTRMGDDGLPLGIIHRDVSPQNIMVSYRGEVKLVDFGISKATAWISRSQPGVIKGKFLYLSPEQLSEEPVDSRADLFALGTMLYELTTGKSPFYRPETEGVIYAIRVEEPPAPHTLRAGYPLSLSRIIQKCLVKDRANRFQSADEIRLALEDALLVDMPTTKADVVTYVAGLFGADDERTGIYVPPNVAVNLLKRDPVTLHDDEISSKAREALVAPPPPPRIAANPPPPAPATTQFDEENTASMPPPEGYKPPPPVPTAAQTAVTQRVAPAETGVDDDDEATATALTDPRSGQAAAREHTVTVHDRPGPPVPIDTEVQDISYESVARERPEVSEVSQSANSMLDDLIRMPPPSGATQKVPSGSSVQVDLDALMPTSLSSPRPRPDETQEPSARTELQLPSYPPVGSQPVVRPGPPVSEETTEPGARDAFRRVERPRVEATPPPPPPPPKPLPMPVAPPRQQQPPHKQNPGPGPTNLNPIDPLDDSGLSKARVKKARRIVKRRVAGDPDDNVATADFRDNENQLEEDSEVSGSSAEGSSPWLVAATIALASLALLMIAWLVWPSSPTQLTPSPQKDPKGNLLAPPSPPPPGLVNVQFRAPRSTLIYLDGAAINPGEIRALAPGPLSLAYRCMPLKKGQKARDLSLATRVPAAGPMPFVIELNCK